MGTVRTESVPSTYETFTTGEMPSIRHGYCDSCHLMLSVQVVGGLAYGFCDPIAKSGFYDLRREERFYDV
jgi:hypothetical protein